MSHQNPRVAVIGAGASGLAALKTLTELGLAPVAFEASSRLGGIWVYRDGENQRSPGYRSLRANTSKQITAFSDLPFRAEAPDFPGRSSVESLGTPQTRNGSLQHLLPARSYTTGCSYTAASFAGR
jgi:cation diffusion facilitator CzcD-associated flavoprotein CzcO